MDSKKEQVKAILKKGIRHRKIAMAHGFEEEVRYNIDNLAEEIDKLYEK